jgi:hypothetical protein
MTTITFPNCPCCGSSSSSFQSHASSHNSSSSQPIGSSSNSGSSSSINVNYNVCLPLYADCVLSRSTYTLTVSGVGAGRCPSDACSVANGTFTLHRVTPTDGCWIGPAADQCSWVSDPFTFSGCPSYIGASTLPTIWRITIHGSLGAYTYNVAWLINCTGQLPLDFGCLFQSVLTTCSGGNVRAVTTYGDYCSVPTFVAVS